MPRKPRLLADATPRYLVRQGSELRGPYTVEGLESLVHLGQLSATVELAAAATHDFRPATTYTFYSRLFPSKEPLVFRPTFQAPPLVGVNVTVQQHLMSANFSPVLPKPESEHALEPSSRPPETAILPPDLLRKASVSSVPMPVLVLPARPKPLSNPPAAPAIVAAVHLSDSRRVVTTVEEFQALLVTDPLHPYVLSITNTIREMVHEKGISAREALDALLAANRAMQVKLQTAPKQSHTRSQDQSFALIVGIPLNLLLLFLACYSKGMERTSFLWACATIDCITVLLYTSYKPTNPLAHMGFLGRCSLILVSSILLSTFFIASIYWALDARVTFWGAISTLCMPVLQALQSIFPALGS